MKKKYNLSLLIILLSFTIGYAQNIQYSWSVSQNSSTSYTISYNAQTTSGTEVLTGIAMRWYYDASEVTVSSFDDTYLTTTQSWGTGNRTQTSAGSDSRTVNGNAYTTRFSYDNFDQNFTGFTITTTPVALLTITISNATGTSETGNNAAMASASDIAGLQYTDAAFSGHNVVISGSQTQEMEVVTSTYTGTWDNGDPEDLRAFDDAVISSGTYSSTGDISVNDLTIAAGAVLNAGSNSVTTAGTFTCNADNSDYAQYIGPATSIVFEQYVGSSAGWRHLGWPVNGDMSTLSGVTVNYGGGAFGNAYGFNNGTFAWDATANSSVTPGADGISLYVGGADFPVTDNILTWTGTSNASASSFTYDYASNVTGHDSLDGWNLFANPYPCNVDWHNIDDQQSGVFSTYSIYNPNTNTYATYSASGGSSGSFTASRYVAAGQAIWVKTSTGDDGKTISIQNSDRTSTGGNTFIGNFKTSSSDKGTLDRIRLNVASQSTGYNDGLVVIFPGASTEAFDSRYDGHKPKNLSPYPNFYSKASTGEGLAINGFGAFDAAKIVPVAFKSDQYETYEIDLEMNDIDPLWGDIYLVDTYANKIHNLTKDGAYSFMNSQTAPEDRFEIRFSISVGTDEAYSSSDHINIYSFEKTIAISRPNPTGKLTVALYNLAGQKVFEEDFGNDKLVEFTTSLPKAYYLVTATDANGAQESEKVVVQ